MENLNHHQMSIITILGFKEEARFAELNTENIPTDHFNYHIKTLTQNGFVEKSTDNKYKLTIKGKTYLSQIDIFNNEVEKQPITSVVAVCIKKVGNEKYYLMHQRKKHPYFDTIVYPSGKVKHGVYLEKEVLRELEEETGLKGKNPKLKYILHNINLLKSSDNSQTVDDKIFYYFVIEEFISDDLLQKTIEGENTWMTKEEILKNEAVFPTVKTSFNYIDLEGISFVEDTLEIENY